MSNAFFKAGETFFREVEKFSRWNCYPCAP